MADLPRISIVTPSFNSGATIAATIESVLSQDYTNWEHIVMDGGSNDGTLAVLERYPRLVWVSEKDEGHYHAMNKGIARATGDVVVILNADDCFRAGALRQVAEAFQRNPGWDALFGDVVFVDGAGREIYRREEAVYDYKVLLYGVDYICHQTLFVRKPVYDRLGLYRHKEFLNSADYEFKLRLGREGCRVGHLPALLVDYRYHVRGQSADLRIIRNMIQEAVSSGASMAILAGGEARASGSCSRPGASGRSCASATRVISFPAPGGLNPTCATRLSSPPMPAWTSCEHPPVGRVLIPPPLPAIGTCAERGCPRPQRVRKGAALGARGEEARIVGAAAAEDSRAPVAVSRCAPPRSGSAFCAFCFARATARGYSLTALSGGVMVAQESLELFVMVRIHAGQPPLMGVIASKCAALGKVN